MEHEIVSEHHPALEINLAGVRVQRIDFDLDVSLKLEGFVLTIQGGKIKGVRLGTYQGEASLAWEGIVLLKAESEAMPIGEEVDLGEGVLISPS